MTSDELLTELYDKTLTGNGPAVLDLTRTGLDQGLGPETLLYEALIPALEEVGARFERGDFFVPEMLIAGKAMAGALEILRPLLAETGAETIGTVVMGTVKGDVHDIGKNLVNIMFEGAGFQVIVMVGGAPVTQEYADVVGADGYAADASAAVVKAKELIRHRRALANV
jgi:methanogenic corrinoid protein MtbC1